MEILVLCENNNNSTVDGFFSKFEEFTENKELAEQTARFIKVLLRHPEPETVEKITDIAKNGRSFKVSGSCRTYTIVFEIKDDTVILKELW